MAEDGVRVVMDERAVRRAIGRMAREILDKNGGAEGLVLIGIQRRGVELAHLLADEIEKAEGLKPPTGSLDITLYRDDLSVIGPRPVIGPTHIPVDIEGQNVVSVRRQGARMGVTRESPGPEAGESRVHAAP